MPIIVSVNDRTPVHVDSVAYIAHVPSRREAEAAYCRLIARFPIDQIEAQEFDIEMVRNFIWSR